ncbi:NGG1p interacting factor 3 [Sistotremastrum niveocremeum HHB9708]|uniref:NGG1p interacting factor 3 n=1 Tax=Sistotremastrum niveocremeum HHB9708 TaxID=1314777 RepID=A0A164UL10_9AGAM|nr:NGG1p interacting factor 3 [Sistotremastrum niveocremeum HHB9708]
MASLKHIISILERLAPPRLAESWDNTGIILHPEKLRANSPRILLTIDLTPAVCQEALDTPTSVIVAYHPPIFKPLSSLSYNDPIQNSLLKCAVAGIAVYCPHTALDTVQGGINDWLAHGLGNGGVESIRSIPGEDVGIGRRVSLADEVPLDALVAKIKNFLHITNGTDRLLRTTLRALY